MITAPMMASERPVPICGTGTGPIWGTPDSSSASAISFTPIKTRMAAEGHPSGRVEEARPEDIEDPAETAQRRGADSDEDPAQQEREDNRQQQDPAVEFPRHGGAADQDHEDEQVVHREAVLGEPAREELASGGR